MSNSHSLPIFRGLSGYRAAWLRGDISAGLSIAAVGLPSAIAYPAIAGLPPETGIYASIAAPLAYAVFGDSRRLIVGPDAATMTVLAAAIAAIAAGMPPSVGIGPAGIAAALSIGVGVLCLVARAMRLGVLATFLSRPILAGFFAGISVSILVGQIGRFTGVRIEADGLLPPLIELVRKWDLIHWPTVALALAMFASLQALKVLRFPVPGPVVVVAAAVALSAVFDFKGMGIAVVGDIPTGFPTLSFPPLASVPIDGLLLGAASVFLVSFGSGIVAARSFGARIGEDVDANRELSGLGSANIASGLFGAFPVSFSDSRTAINLSVGGRSQFAGVVSALALIATLLFLNDALRILPVAALAAILAAAALGLIDVAELKQVWRISRMEFVFALITMWGAISLGVLNGVVIAIAATLVYLLRNMMHPRDAFLGRIPGRDGFYKLHRRAEAQPVPGLVFWMLEGSLLFFNTDYVHNRLRTIIAELPEGTRWFILDASAITQMDSTATAMMDEIRKEMAARGIELGLVEVHAEARALLERAGVIDRIGTGRVFDDLDDALQAFEDQEVKKGAAAGS